jgi:hypothetical protein
MRLRLSTLYFALPLALGCAADSATDDGPGPGGKADVDAVRVALEQVTADGELSADDVAELFDAAGGNLSRGEALTIRDAIASTDFKVTDEAKQEAFDRAYVANLFDYEVDALLQGTGYDGAEIPQAVRDLVAKARLNGAAAFDVRERRGDGEGRWSPYPTTSPPVGNMAFDYTRITPEILAADVAATDLEYKAIVGSETAEQCDAAGSCFEFEQARYEDRVGGTGNIQAHYDEVWHPELEARGSSGQKWASNCAFLSDGSIHCLPAPRRSVLQDLILTNPHLSRCNRIAGFEEACHTVMYLGHITARGGVIQSVEVSGRVSKRIAKGQANLIDPIALFDAWGFERSPSLTVRFGNTEDGLPVTNADGGVLETADP